MRGKLFFDDEEAYYVIRNQNVWVVEDFPFPSVMDILEYAVDIVMIQNRGVVGKYFLVRNGFINSNECQIVIPFPLGTNDF